MKPVVIIAPLALVAGGLVTFFLVPFQAEIRLALLLADFAAAGFVGFIVWRRGG